MDKDDSHNKYVHGQMAAATCGPSR